MTPQQNGISWAEYKSPFPVFPSSSSLPFSHFTWFLLLSKQKKKEVRLPNGREHLPKPKSSVNQLRSRPTCESNDNHTAYSTQNKLERDEVWENRQKTKTEWWNPFRLIPFQCWHFILNGAFHRFLHWKIFKSKFTQSTTFGLTKRNALWWKKFCSPNRRFDSLSIRIHQTVDIRGLFGNRNSQNSLRELV